MIFNLMGWGRVGVGSLVALLALASCSDDWDSHYAPSTGDATSLWESISQESSVSNFSKVLKVADFDRKLSGSQAYTVFALTNDALSASQADSLVEAYQTQKAAGVPTQLIGLVIIPLGIGLTIYFARKHDEPQDADLSN